jgi:hypothetical protein
MKALTTQKIETNLEKVLIQGDLAPLSEAERIKYVRMLCKAMGISILFRPFDFIKFNGKVFCYPNKNCTDQLRKNHNISIKVTTTEHVNGLYVVMADATMRVGREVKSDSDVGATNCKGLAGEALANALMKATTKAKRRVTLSICGLGFLDEETVREMAEKESKLIADVQAEATQEKIGETTSQPVFAPPAGAPSVEPQLPTNSDYILKAGRNQGKKLRNVPLSSLVKWLKFYSEKQEQGEKMHADIHDDAVAIDSFMKQAAVMSLNPEGGSENG